MIGFHKVCSLFNIVRFILGWVQTEDEGKSMSRERAYTRRQTLIGTYCGYKHALATMLAYFINFSRGQKYHVYLITSEYSRDILLPCL